MSKEVAAAILTQTYFLCSDTAAKRINREVDADPAKGAEPAAGAIAPVVQTYAMVLEMMGKFKLA
jgi:hypothetical protein